jgi:predicted dinucleotide-binding enzyme
MRVTVIGPGSIGGGLARLLAPAGHEITLTGGRDPSRRDALARTITGEVRAAELGEAIDDADVVVLAVPWASIPDVLEAVGDLAGKTVIDTTNHFEAGGLVSLPHERTAARVNADRMPGARLVKAFNTLTAGFQQEAAHRPGEPAVIFLCGDDADAKATAGTLIIDAGFAPCDLGGLDDAAPMEAPRRPGAVYGEEYRPAEAERARVALAEGRPLRPTPQY